MTGTEATLKAFLTSNALPSHEELLKLTDGVLSVLENESTSYRPHDKEGKPGGLLDFTAKEYSSLPVAVLPDLHGRGNFLLKFLTHKINDKPVLELLEHEQIIVCCVGDIFHSEQRGKERWINAWKGFQSGDYTNSFMQEEMKENLSLLQMIFLLKTKYPSFFHVLKGNHENILNEYAPELYGNVPFIKFCDEGNMVKTFMQDVYDDLIIHEISCFEKSLPVCAAFFNCVVSHAEPVTFFSKEQIINYHQKGSLVTIGLTWTKNGEAKDGTVIHLIKELLPQQSQHTAVYLAGHRPVAETHALRQEGKFIQIHNPDKEQFALVTEKALAITQI